MSALPASRRRLLAGPVRVVAVVLWSAFVGACLMAVAVLALQDMLSAPQMGWGEASRLFFIAWVICIVPAAFTALLADPAGAGEPRP